MLVISKTATCVDVGDPKSVVLLKTDALTLRGWLHKGVEQPFAVSEVYSGMIISEGQTADAALYEAQRVAKRGLFLKHMFTRKKRMEAHTILAIIRRCANLDDEDTLRLTAVLDYRTGKFKKKKPEGIMGALWSILQPNIYKMNVGAVMLYQSDALVQKLIAADIKLPAKFDSDAEALQSYRVWP